MRLVIDLIRGKSVNEALHVLHFSPKHASKVAEKVLRSAISNLQNKDEAGRLEPEDIMVKEAFVDGGTITKRISPAPMGRAYRIRKRSNHLTIIVTARAAGKAAQKPRPAAAKAEPKPAKAEAKAPKAESKAPKKESKAPAKKSAAATP